MAAQIGLGAKPFVTKAYPTVAELLWSDKGRYNVRTEFMGADFCCNNKGKLVNAGHAFVYPAIA